MTYSQQEASGAGTGSQLRKGQTRTVFFGRRPRCQHRPGGSRGRTADLTISDKGCGDTMPRHARTTSFQRTPTPAQNTAPHPSLFSVSQAEPRFAGCGSRRAGRQGATGRCRFLLAPPQEPARPPPPCWAGRHHSAGASQPPADPAPSSRAGRRSKRAAEREFR